MTLESKTKNLEIVNRGNIAQVFALFFHQNCLEMGVTYFTKSMYFFPLLHIYIEKKSISKKIYNCD